MKKLSILIMLLGLVSCSSTKKERVAEDVEHEDLEKEYVVKDSSSKARPGWIEDAEVWAKAYGKDVKKYRYFSFETEPKVSRGISCNLAKANVRADIAGEITTFIDKQLGFSEEGSASVDENNPNVKALRDYVDNTLTEKVQSLVHGAAVRKVYWEKRQYQKDLGAKKDFRAYTCAVFVRMNANRLKSAVEAAANQVLRRAQGQEMKGKVKKALEQASNDFIKTKQGEI